MPKQIMHSVSSFVFVVVLSNIVFSVSFSPMFLIRISDSSWKHASKFQPSQIKTLQTSQSCSLDPRSDVLNRRRHCFNLYSNKNSGSSRERKTGNNSKEVFSLQVNSKVEVIWDGQWWPAVVIDVDHSRRVAHVQFCESLAQSEEWIRLDDNRIRLVRLDHSVSRLGMEGGLLSADELHRDDDRPDEIYWEMLGGGGAADMDADFLDLLIELHASLLPSSGHILDLCAGSRSALPPAVEGRRVEGLGLVGAQLARNAWLDAWAVADLNAAPAPPQLRAAAFDAVICTGGLPYLVRPLEVLRAARQALKPAGVLAVRQVAPPRRTNASQPFVRTCRLPAPQDVPRLMAAPAKRPGGSCDMPAAGGSCGHAGSCDMPAGCRPAVVGAESSFGRESAGQVAVPATSLASQPARSRNRPRHSPVSRPGRGTGHVTRQSAGQVAVPATSLASQPARSRYRPRHSPCVLTYSCSL